MKFDRVLNVMLAKSDAERISAIGKLSDSERANLLAGNLRIIQAEMGDVDSALEMQMQVSNLSESEQISLLSETVSLLMESAPFVDCDAVLDKLDLWNVDLGVLLQP